MNKDMIDPILITGCVRSGVYEILCIVTDKRYVGSSVNIMDRLKEHKRALVQKGHGNSHLQNAWNKYGETTFEFNPLLYCGKENLLFYEQRVIDVFQVANEKGYNICPIAGNTLGRACSKETKLKMSEALKGNTNTKGHIHTEETKRKIARSERGRIVSKETKAKLSVKLKGRVLSEETKRKISASKKGQTAWNKGKECPQLCGVNNGFYGKTHSEETKRKIVQANKGFKHSAESKRKISIVHKGTTQSLETKRKISEALKGRIVTNEARGNMSLAQRRTIYKHLRDTNGRFVTG